MATSITNTSITTDDLVVDSADNLLKVDHATNRVGIGTINPCQKLHISSTDHTKVSITGGTDKYAELQFENDAQKFAMGVQNDDKFFLYNSTGTSQVLTVDTSSNVGIGTQTPSSKLHVAGSTTIANDEGYFAANLTEVSNQAMALRISPTRESVTKGITLGAMGTTNTGTGIQAYDTSDNSANDLQINPFGGAVAIGKTTALTNSALTIGGSSQSSYSSTIYLDNELTGGTDGWINTTDDTWTLKTNAGQAGLAIGTGVPQSSTARIVIGNNGLITMGKLVNDYIATSYDSGSHVHTTGPVAIGHNSNQNEWRKGGRVVKGWYAVGYQDTGSGNYIHLSTDLWGGGSPNGNNDYIMGGFEIRGHRYSTGSSVARHTIYFHNWSGSTAPGYSVSSSGNWNASPSTYVNSSGYVTLRLPNSAYYGFIIDLHQYNWYPIRDITVTSVQVNSSNI